MDFIYLYERAKNPLSIVLCGVGRGLKGRDDGGNVKNVQYKFNWNCHYEFSLYNEYILIKVIIK
jgi:hypothetical protein